MSAVEKKKQDLEEAKKKKEEEAKKKAAEEGLDTSAGEKALQSMTDAPCIWDSEVTYHRQVKVNSKPS